MIKKGWSLIGLIVIGSIVTTVLMEAVKPYMHYIGIVLSIFVTVVCVGLVVRLFFSRRRPW